MIITLTSHYPYYMPGDKAFLYLEPPLATSNVGAYLQSICYADHAIGQFIEGLRESGLLENSIVVIYGDHDGLFKRDQKELEKVWALQEISDEEWIRDYAPVPLLIYADELSGKTFETYGGQIDFLPTISHIMGIEQEKHPYAMGNNLLTVQESFALVPQGDYNNEPVRVSSDRIDFSLNIFDQETLKVADLMIKTNFCAKQ
jgi:lipoteichoic acid synthase